MTGITPSSNLNPNPTLTLALASRIDTRFRVLVARRPHSISKLSSILAEPRRGILHKCTYLHTILDTFGMLEITPHYSWQSHSWLTWHRRFLRIVIFLTITVDAAAAAARDRGHNIDGLHSKVETNPNVAASFRPPPPPPPPYTIDSSIQEPTDAIPSSPNLNINPIHYNFPVKEMDPVVSSPTNDIDKRSRDVPTRRLYPADYSSARQDAVTRFSSTQLGKVKLTASSTLVGVILGSFIGKSLLGHAMPISSIFAMLFLCSNFFRNDYGELSRALGLALIYMLARLQRVRQRYPTGPYILVAVGIRSRTPFPPVGSEETNENPWSYQPQTRIDPDFDMIKSLIAVVIIGSFCGGTIPLIPTWIGSSAGALTSAFLCTSKTGRGDLTRIMGMRVVSLVLEALDINRELRIGRKSGVVAGKIFDKVMILDRKHRIKDRLIQVLNWVYEKVASTASQVQKDARQRDT